MRPSTSSAMQLVVQAWLIQRDALPPTLALITSPPSARRERVGSGCDGSCGWRSSALLRRDALADVFDEHLPLGDVAGGEDALAVHAAFAHLDAAAAGNGYGLALAASDVIRYIEMARARVYVCAGRAREMQFR